VTHTHVTHTHACRRTQTLFTRVSHVSPARLQEREFFEESGIDQYHGVRTGLPLLRKELSVTLLRKISGEFPRILEKLDAAIEEVRTMCTDVLPVATDTLFVCQGPSQ